MKKKSNIITKLILTRMERLAKHLIDFNVISSYNHYDKKIFLVRDPRDQLIGEFFYQWWSGHGLNRDEFYLCLEMVQKKELNPSTIPFYSLPRNNEVLFSNVQRNRRAEKSLKDEGADELRNTWLKTNKERENLYKLGVKTSQARRVDFMRIEACIQNLRNRIFYSTVYDEILYLMKRLDASWKIIKYGDLIDFNVQSLEEFLNCKLIKNSCVPSEFRRVINTKKYGNWRYWFTDEDVIYYEKIFRKFMKRVGYDCNNVQLKYPKKLNSRYGSEYMRRLYINKENL